MKGFQSLLKLQCLNLLLCGKQPSIWMLARDTVTLCLPKPKRAALKAVRLIVVSPFSSSASRTNANNTRKRNRWLPI